MMLRKKIRTGIIVQFYCDRCGWRITATDENTPEDVRILDPMRADQHLCADCQGFLWSEIKKDCCPRCHTEPCKHGEKCWIDPFPKILDACHFGERIGPYHPGLIRGLRLMDEYLEGIVSIDLTEQVPTNGVA